MSSSSQAASYECGSESQRDTGIEVIGKLKIERGSTILDLGCGTGSLAKVLSDQVGPKGKVVAVDPDEERLKVARKKYSASNIEFIRGDDKTFPSGQYDLIFCNVVIHWISDKEGLHKRVYENLLPGGRFAFTTPNGSMPVPEIGRKLFGELVGPDFLHWIHTEVTTYLTAEEYKALASAAGFEQTSTTVENLWLQWKNLDHYIDAVYGWYGGRFDPSHFDRDAFRKLKEEYGDGPVVLTEPMKKLEVILTKPTTQNGHA